MTGRRIHVEVMAQAKADIARLRDDDVALGRRAAQLVGLIATGDVVGKPLRSMVRYGDLSDCRTVYFGVGRHQASHRLVYLDSTDGTRRVLSVVAAETRQQGYVYAATAARLKRLPDHAKPSYNQLHQKIIAERSTRRQGRQGPSR